MVQIQYGTTEYYNAIEMFEKSIKTGGVYVASLEREKKEDAQNYSKKGMLIVYTNGNTNNLFKLFISGVNYGISLCD